MRRSIRHNELDSCRIRGVSQQHLFDEDAAQAMRYKNHLTMVPDMVLLEVSPENLSQLHTGHPAIRRRRGIFSNLNVGIGKARVRPNHIRPIGAVRCPPGVAAPVQAMYKNNDSCPRGCLRLALLYRSLRKQRGKGKEEEQGEQNTIDLPIHPTISAHLDPEI